MRVFSTVMKVVAAAAAVVGAVYVAATYGDQIVAWAKKALSSLSKCPCCKNAEPAVEEAPVEEAPAEVAPAEEAPVEEAPAEEAPVEETVPVADENDFEG
ncbi:MAG: hypothetical protein SPI15_09075 [Candidatus Faecousia sp.]|nr:hypothetical protein [Clostridiales bacterium]MDY6180991.1 hypothetical protein [Candidatus Faecousia sp.]